MLKQNSFTYVILLLSLGLLSGCLNTKKIDAFIADQYNNQLPKQEKKKNTDIIVKPAVPFATENISTTISRTSKVLPLIVYWQWDYRRTSTLNPAIGINNFTKAVNLQANKELGKKLEGQQLELTVEQVPNEFAMVEKGHLVWLIYPLHWSKVYVEPDFKDLIVSYKVLQNGGETKSGKIIVKSNAGNEKIRYFQSWRSVISEHLGQYNLDIATMAKTFVANLIQEL